MKLNSSAHHKDAPAQSAIDSPRLPVMPAHVAVQTVAPQTKKTLVNIPDARVLPELLALLHELHPRSIACADLRKLEVLVSNTFSNKQIERLSENESFQKALTDIVRLNLGGDGVSLPGVPPSQYKERLLKVSQVLNIFFKRNINPEAGAAEPQLVDRLMRRVQQFDLGAAITLFQNGLEAGCSFADVAVRSLLSDALVRAHSIEDLRRFGALAERALDRNALELTEPKNVRSLNFYLAILSDPKLLGSRLSENYHRETDIVDVAERLTVAAQVALAIVRSDFRFTEAYNRSRINMTVRALASIGAALHLDRIQATEIGLSDEIMSDLKRSFGVHIEWTGASPIRHIDAKTEVISDSLIRAALKLAESSFRETRDSSASRHAVEKFELDASTLNTLLYSFAASEFQFSQSDCATLTALMQKSTKLRDVRIRLYSFALSAGMNELLFAEHIPAKIRADTLLTMATIPYFARPNATLIKGIVRLHDHAYPNRDSLPLEARERLQRLEGRHASRSNAPSPGPQVLHENNSYDPANWFSSLVEESNGGAVLLRNIRFNGQNS